MTQPNGAPSGASGGAGSGPPSGQQGAGTPGQGGTGEPPKFVTPDDLNNALGARLSRLQERLEEQIAALAGKIQAAPATPPAPGSPGGKKDDSELLARVEAAEKAAQQERELRIRHEKVGVLRDMLSTLGCRDVTSALEILVQRGDLKPKAGAHGAIEWVGAVKEQFGGTREAPVAEVVAEFLRERPVFAPAIGSGSGARGAAGGAPGSGSPPSWSGKKLIELSADELRSMPQADRLKLMNAESGSRIGVLGQPAK